MDFIGQKHVTFLMVRFQTATLILIGLKMLLSYGG